MESLAERIRKMDSVSVCMELEGGDLMEDFFANPSVKAAQELLNKVSCLRHSTGSYGRFCNDLENYIAENSGE